MNAQNPRPTSICCVLASDAKFFDQARAAIATIKRFGAAFQPAIKYIAINLRKEQLHLLEAQGVEVISDISDFPRFNGAPDYAVALTCRPYLPEVFSGYEGYFWVDSDIRFLDEEGFRFFVSRVRDPEVSIIISHETEPAYIVNSNPSTASVYHRQKNQRLLEAFGQDVMKYLEFFNLYNAGLFAARADSPIWVRYQRNLEKTLPLSFSSLREQDALNVSIAEVKGQLNAPCTMNWLCSMSLPTRDGDGSWHSPDVTKRKISVAHLTNSTNPVQMNGKTISLYEYYRLIGLSD